MQLLDENHVLIRYSTEYAANCSVDNPNDEVSFFMVYNMATTTVYLLFHTCIKILVNLDFSQMCL